MASALICSALMLIGITGVGAMLHWLIRDEQESDPVADLAIILGLGIVGYAGIVVAIGFFPLLRQPTFVVLAALSCGGVFVRRRQLRDVVVAVARTIGNSLRHQWIVTIPAVVVLGLIVIAGHRPPSAFDELFYHWPAPELWAKTHHWVTSPFTFTNGFHLAEVLYTQPAVFHAPTSAHWLHTATLGLLMLSTCVIARKLGGSGAMAATAILAVPAAAMQSWWAYNDVFAAALLVTAFAAELHSTTNRSRWATGLLILGAISVKPIMVVFTPIVILAMGVRTWQQHDDDTRARWTASLAALIPLLLPAALGTVGWLFYTHHFTGDWLQSSGLTVAKAGENTYQSQLATLRVPTVKDIVLIPFLPILTGIIGSREPYGGRTGLVLTVFTPLSAIALVVMGRLQRRRFAVATIPVVVTFLCSSLVIVRTRFNLSLYALGIALIVATLAWSRDRLRPRLYGATVLLFQACVIGGLIDTMRHLAI